MNHSGDAAEQIVRLSLEGFDVAARLTGSAAKHIAFLLVAALKQEQQTKGKARLTNMIKSGKELKVFSIPQKDLKTFTKQAKRYGVLYCVLRDRNTNKKDSSIDIFVRAEDISKIQRIIERFKIGNVEEKAEIINQAQKDAIQKQEFTKDIPEKSKNENITEQAVKSCKEKEGPDYLNPNTAKTEKNPPLRQNLDMAEVQSKQGDKNVLYKKPSVKEKLNKYILKAKNEKDTERFANTKEKSTSISQNNGKTVEKFAKKKSKGKER